MLAAEQSDDDPLVQLNVRVRRSTKAHIEARCAELIDPKTKRPMGQGRWVENAALYALDAPRRPTANSQRRTAPPPR